MYLKSLSLRYILLYGPFYMVRSMKNRWKVWGVITFLFGSLSVEALEPVYVNVLSTGVVNDGVTMNTRALQSAIDSCAHAGGGTLYFPSGRYLTGSLFLRDNITLFLEAGAVVLGSPDLKDYYLPEQSYISFRNDVAAVINAEYCRNIKLTGLGNWTFDGQGTLFPFRYEAYRLKLFRFVGRENVLIKNIVMGRVNNSLFIWLGNRSGPYHPDSLVRNIGSIKNIFISDIVATEIGRFTDYVSVYRIDGEKRGSEYPCVISGIFEVPVESVTLSNLSFSFKGSRVLPVAGPVPEQEAMYPEYKMFGPLPAYGFYACYVKSLTLNNVVFSTDSADSRAPVYCGDIERLTLKELDVEVSEQTPSYVMLKDVGHTTIFDSAFLERGPAPVVASGEVGLIYLSGGIGPDVTSVKGWFQTRKREREIGIKP